MVKNESQDGCDTNLWIFDKKLCDHSLQKIHPIAYNGKQNLLVCCTCQVLLKFLQDALLRLTK